MLSRDRNRRADGGGECLLRLFPRKPPASADLKVVSLFCQKLLQRGVERSSETGCTSLTYVTFCCSSAPNTRHPSIHPSWPVNFLLKSTQHKTSIHQSIHLSIDFAFVSNIKGNTRYIFSSLLRLVIKPAHPPAAASAL